MPRHLMIDIETWDTQPTAVIRAIALAAFDIASTDEPYATRVIDCRRAVDNQIQRGRTVSADTIRWWQAQPRFLDEMMDACATMAPSTAPTTTQEIVDALTRFWGTERLFTTETRVWTRGHMDIAILENLLATHSGVAVPWRYSDVRDVRTLDEITPAVNAIWSHHPYQDCLVQIAQVRRAVVLGQHEPRTAFVPVPPAGDAA